MVTPHHVETGAPFSSREDAPAAPSQAAPETAPPPSRDVVVRSLPELPRIRLQDEQGQEFGTLYVMEIIVAMGENNNESLDRLLAIKNVQQLIAAKFQRVLSPETCYRVIETAGNLLDLEKKNTSNGADSTATDTNPTP